MTTAKGERRPVGQLALAYLRQPEESTWEPLRRAIVSDPTFDPDLDVRRVVGARLDPGASAPEEVVTDLLARMPGAFLNPSAHLALGEALERTGDLEEAHRERAMAAAALHGVQVMGDGSVERPWPVLRVADEYDLLRSLGLRASAQSSRWQGGAFVDRILCQDGVERFFVVRQDLGA